MPSTMETLLSIHLSDVTFTRPSSYFMHSILGVWHSLRWGIIQSLPTLPEKVEHQPLIWDPGVRDLEGCQVGAWTHVD